MRISTNQLYYSSLNNMMASAARTTESQSQLTSGKRIDSAGDDPAAMGSVLELTRQIEIFGKYQSSIEQADARLNREEANLSALEDMLLSARDTLMRGGDGALIAADRQTLADELRESMGAMLDVANSRDESGNYLFGGYQTDRAPFVLQSDGSVSYLGDQGQRQAQIGSGLSVATSDNGQRVFREVANPLGDFVAAMQYASNSEERVRVGIQAARIDDHSSYVEQDYSLMFDDVDADGIIEVDVLDALGNSVMGAVPYEAGQRLSFNGVTVELGEGNPQPGDQIRLSPQGELDVFGLMQQAIDWLESDPRQGSARAESDQHLSMLLDGLDSAFDHVTGVRAGVGSRMKSLERQSAVLEDGKIILQEARSRLEEVDFSQAILDYDKQMLSLQTSQQSYARVSQLSLFNYL